MMSALTSIIPTTRGPRIFSRYPDIVWVDSKDRFSLLQTLSDIPGYKSKGLPFQFIVAGSRSPLLLSKSVGALLAISFSTSLTSMKGATTVPR